MILFVIGVGMLGGALGCVKTADSSTTTVPLTTTTTVAGASCGNCDVNKVALISNGAGDFHPPSSARLGPPQAGTGCIPLEVTCNVLPGNCASMLSFISTGEDLVVGVLVCNPMEEWTYTAKDLNPGSGNDMPVTTAIGSAYCFG